MKKLAAMLLCLVMAFSLAGCGGESQNSESGAGSEADSHKDTSDAGSETDIQEGGSEADTQNGSEAGSENGGTAVSGRDALSVLTVIWDNYPEANKFSCFGGNQNENAVTDAPGKFDLSDKDGTAMLLLLPESVQANVDDASSLIHMMNANTFTSAAVHVTNGDAAGAAEEIKNTIINNQFMCGFPERIAVITAGDYVLYAFGAEANITDFVSTATEHVDGATVVYNELYE